MTREIIIHNVRMKSNAGYYLGSLCFCEDNAEPYDRDSLYYPSEEWLLREYPNSFSLEEAFEKGEARVKRMKLFKKNK